MEPRRRHPTTPVLLLTLAMVLAACGSTPRNAAAPPPGTPTGPTTTAGGPGTHSGSPATPTPSFDPDSFPPPKITTSALLKPFAYDPKAPLHLDVTATRTNGSATIQQITYETPAHTPVNAEIVYPTAPHGRQPGVVLAHGGAIDPDAFLPEALTLATHGIVSILPDIPMTIVGRADTDIAMVTDAVTAERRALDILVARKDVDPTRLAFIGHSWGADLAAIMAGVDPRLTAVAIVCGWSRIATDMYAMGSPTQPPAYMAATSALDGYRFIAISHPRKLLIQYGTQDPNIPEAQRTELTHAATGNSTRHDYDAGHDLINNPEAAKDRLTFLESTFHLH